MSYGRDTFPIIQIYENLCVGVKNCYNIGNGAWPNGRASALGAEGSEFESRCPDMHMDTIQAILPSFTFLHRLDREYISDERGDLLTVLSPVFYTPQPFVSLILSLNLPAGYNGSVLSEVQVLQGNVWSKFFKLAWYGAEEHYSFAQQTDAAASLDVDELKLTSPAQAYRFKLSVKGKRAVPKSALVCVSPQSRPDKTFLELPTGICEIEVRPFSQMQLNATPDMQKRLCSPTSLCMALNALGVLETPLQTAQAVYDTRADIYGNWTLNTAYASSKGLFTGVTRFESFAQLGDCVNAESLVVASIAYQKGELTGAAAEKTPGHLVLICGWEGNKIRVADPAAATADQVIRFYDSEEFARAWLVNKRGVAYLVRKK